MDFLSIVLFGLSYTYVEVVSMVYRRIRDLREDHDWTQAEVAEMLNMTQTGYSKYERGERDIPSEVLIKLANLYNTSIDYLLGQTKNPERIK